MSLFCCCSAPPKPKKTPEEATRALHCPYTPLSLQRVQNLLQLKANIHPPPKDREFPKGRRSLLFRLINERNSPDSSVDLCEVLLQNGANPNEIMRENSSVIGEAVKVKRVKILKLLLAYKANPNGNANQSATPLFLAIANKSHEIVRLLLESRADPNQLSALNAWPYEDYPRYREDPLTQAVCENSPKIVALLLQNGAQLREGGERNLYRAISLNNLSLFKLLLTKFEQNFFKKIGGKLIVFAIRKQSFEVVEYLIQQGVVLSENALEFERETARFFNWNGWELPPLVRLLSKTSPKILSLLLETINPKECLIKGLIKEEMQSESPSVEILRILFQYNIDPDQIPFKRGLHRYSTPLTLAIDRKLLEVAQFLRSYNAKKHQTPRIEKWYHVSDGSSLLELIFEREVQDEKAFLKLREMVRFLIEEKVDLFKLVVSGSRVQKKTFIMCIDSIEKELVCFFMSYDKADDESSLKPFKKSDLEDRNLLPFVGEFLTDLKLTYMGEEISFSYARDLLKH